MDFFSRKTIWKNVKNKEVVFFKQLKVLLKYWQMNFLNKRWIENQPALLLQRQILPFTSHCFDLLLIAFLARRNPMFMFNKYEQWMWVVWYQIIYFIFCLLVWLFILSVCLFCLFILSYVDYSCVFVHYYIWPCYLSVSSMALFKVQRDRIRLWVGVGK